MSVSFFCCPFPSEKRRTVIVKTGKRKYNKHRKEVGMEDLQKLMDEDFGFITEENIEGISDGDDEE